MSSEEKPVIYRNGYLPKSESRMHKYGRELAENPPKVDYSNSHRSQRQVRTEAAGRHEPSPPGTGLITEDKADGFFKATLKQAASAAYHDVVDPAVRNFLDNTIVSMVKTMIWGENARKYFTYNTGQTPYREISTGRVMQPQALPEGQRRLSFDDKSWQKYYRCRAATRERAWEIMRKMYTTMRLKGQVTLAEYYQAFGYPFDITDEEWGWTSLPDGRMYTEKDSEGYYHVMMPKLEVLESEIRR